MERMRLENCTSHEGRREEHFFGNFAASPISKLIEPSSNIGTPGSSSPPAEESIEMDFDTPLRPKSTPFPFTEHQRSYAPMDDSENDSGSQMDDASDSEITLFDSVYQAVPSIGLQDLPIEVLEAILDHIFGFRISPTSRSGMEVSSIRRSWGTAMRHARRRQLTELALVSQVWRILVQQRLYRHIKLQGTYDSLEGAMLHFAQNQHLQPYVMHMEIWFPVFQPSYGRLVMSPSLSLPTVTTDGLTNAAYVLPGNNCTLEGVFQFVAATLPHVQVLSLEGGERRKAPKVHHFHSRDNGNAGPRSLTPISSVSTLITKGQWNLMRDNEDFATVLGALPNLTHWDGSYSRPKSKSYITLCEFLPQLPPNISNLKLCLETDYRREPVMPAFFSKAAVKSHFCSVMAANLSQLEHLSYTGRVCHMFLDTAMRSVDPRNTRLKSLDLTVKNCCRPLASFHESGSGIQDMGFIEAFEKLVVSAVRSLAVLNQVEYMRIRFVDLDSVLPALNPFFLLQNGVCSGVWSERIINEMNRARPHVTFVELSHSFGNIIYNKEGRMVVAPENPCQTKITSLKLENYRLLANRMTIH
ncbi:unnamed protein product [Clonostachys rhizophaga]|uniref:Uncharacterized protein n=1 Tax=Clonostachys rhizophaga TaxID=160324 RepID=A0A9N9YES6_9HYPO|nr:unnamed protein product [Clonostachys rhizophaga]